MGATIRAIAVVAIAMLLYPAAWSQETPTKATTDESQLLLDGGADAPTSDSTSASGDSGSDIWGYLVRMILVLGLVALSVYGVVVLVRRVTKRQTFESEGIKLLASRQLGPGRALHVVSVGTQTLLIGATDSAVSLVAEITDKVAVDAMHLRADEAPEAPKRDFLETMRRLLGGGVARKPGETEADYLKRQRERIRKL